MKKKKIKKLIKKEIMKCMNTTLGVIRPDVIIGTIAGVKQTPRQLRIIRDKALRSLEATVQPPRRE